MKILTVLSAQCAKQKTRIYKISYILDLINPAQNNSKTTKSRIKVFLKCFKLTKWRCPTRSLQKMILLLIVKMNYFRVRFHRWFIFQSLNKKSNRITKTSGIASKISPMKNPRMTLKRDNNSLKSPKRRHAKETTVLCTWCLIKSQTTALSAKDNDGICLKKMNDRLIDKL